MRSLFIATLAVSLPAALCAGCGESLHGAPAQVNLDSAALPSELPQILDTDSPPVPYAEPARGVFEDEILLSGFVLLPAADQDVHDQLV